MSDQQEPGKFELAPELFAVQNKLANLSPKALRIDRDQLMFNAGRAAERAAVNAASPAVLGPVGITPPSSTVRSARFWPAATATMTAAAILLAAMLIHDRGRKSTADLSQPPSIDIAGAHSVSTAPPFATRTPRSRSTTGYLGIRNTALDRGLSAFTTELDAVPIVSPPQSKPATARDLRDELLPTMPHQRS